MVVMVMKVRTIITIMANHHGVQVQLVSVTSVLLLLANDSCF